MNQNDVKTELKRILIDDLFIEVPEDMIKDDDTIGTDLGLDSIGFVEFATIISERMSIPIQESDITSGSFTTISTLADFVVSSAEAKMAS